MSGHIAFALNAVPGAATAFGGKEFSDNGWKTMADTIGAKPEEVKAVSGAIQDVAAGVVGFMYSGGNPAAAAAAVSASQGLRGAGEEIGNGDYDWEDWLENSAISIGTAGLGNIHVGYAAAANIGVQLAKGEEWEDILENTGWQMATTYVASGAPGGRHSLGGFLRGQGVTGVRMSLEDDPEEQNKILVNSISNAVTKSYRDKYRTSQNQELNFNNIIDTDPEAPDGFQEQA